MSFIPPPQMSTNNWANKYRWLAKGTTAKAGKYSSDYTPWVKGMLDALDDPEIREVVCTKSSQVAWTDGAWNNYLGRRMHQDPCGILMLMPKETSINKYLRTKFNPMVTATPVLNELINLGVSRSSDNTKDYKEFPGGGFLALVGSGSPDNVKSWSVPVGCVEEPDDCSGDVQGQGDSVEHLRDRLKTFEDSKLIFGGTPTIKGFSRVEEAYKKSDRRQFWVPCHECGEYHVLHWDNVIIPEDPSVNHEVYGRFQPEQAYYVCPHNGCIWDDRQKNLNVKKAEWRAEAETKGVAGFKINELYSPFPGSKLAALADKFLVAQQHLKQGDEGKMIHFTNTTLGEAYEYKDGSPDAETLEAKAENYSVLIPPQRSLLMTAGIDVQPDRLAVVLMAWGRGEESWIVYWGEIHAVTSVNDLNDPCWYELDRVLSGVYRHESGAPMRIAAAGIDSGDGNTNDAVYHYVRSRKAGIGPKLMAIKGSSEIDAEILKLPKPIDVSATTKAAKWGLQIWVVGVNKLKDLISGRLRLEGSGPGRIHWPVGIRSDFYKQITGESKIPSRKHGGKLVWTAKSGASVEAWDSMGYATHSARVLRINLPKYDWDAREAELSQGDLLGGSFEDDDFITYIDEHPEDLPETSVVPIEKLEVEMDRPELSEPEPKQPQSQQPQPHKPKTRTFKPQTSTRHQTDRPNPPPTAAGKSVADQIAELGRRMGG
ncbi:phage terminase large subunit family protein [Oceanospirillum beijerinckii]|uniref:phage terminase large subunit family protein n=1 Tax=Oceanospirillum beijerinckii TaxID=64976 RepID=UPI0004034EF6|nr:terminase gpA endonuclease subunit [Oceanospirillum beijerinckii]